MGLFQSVAFQQLLLLQSAKDNVFGNQLVFCNVDEQVLLVEVLDDARQGGRDEFIGIVCECGSTNEDTGIEVLLDNGLDEVLERLGAERLVVARWIMKFDPDGTDLWFWVRLALRRYARIFLHHRIGWIRGEVHLLAAVKVRFELSAFVTARHT